MSSRSCTHGGEGIGSCPDSNAAACAHPPPSTASDTGTVPAEEPPACANAVTAYRFRLVSSHREPGITSMYPATPWHSS